MAATLSLRSHLIDELRDLLQKHLKETRNHIARLNQALQDLGEGRTWEKSVRRRPARR